MRPARLPTRLSATLSAGLIAVGLLATVSLAPPAVGVTSTGSSTGSTASRAGGVGDCTMDGPRPCVVSFTVDGETSNDYSYSARTYQVEGRPEVSVHATRLGDSNMGTTSLTHTFSVTLDLGAITPVVVAGNARDVTVRRSQPDGFRVTVTGRPVVVSGQCDQSAYPWTCPEHDVVVKDPADFNNREFVGTFSLQVSDYDSRLGGDGRDPLYGLDYFTNVAATSIPPGIVRDQVTGTYLLELQMGNRRFRENGALVHGRSELRIPDTFLRRAYGVPDPETMTGTSLSVAGAGPEATTSITRDDDGRALVVLLDDLRFPDARVPDNSVRAVTAPSARRSSMRTVRIRAGVLTPVRPHITTARRTAQHRARIDVEGARARGARITGYQARCATGRVTVRSRSGAREVVVRGLRPARAYRCQVRALSKAGPSAWSEPRRVARRP